MDLISEDSVFEVLNDNHEFYLDTSDITTTNNLHAPPPLISSRSISQEEFDFSALLNDNHELYLDTSDLLSDRTCKIFKKPGRKSIILNTDNQLEYLSFIQNEYETRSNAAKKIQKYWRSYYHRKIFFKLKKLVLKYSNSDPVVALRIVNPREAPLLEKASGTYIKFKLAGAKFPPKIVYKIVSRTPVVKVNLVNSILYQAEKSTMTCSDRIETYGLDLKPLKIRTDEKNDWRLYDYECCSKRRKFREHPPERRSKSYVPLRQREQTKSLDKRISELSWIKSQYGF